MAFSVVPRQPCAVLLLCVPVPMLCHHVASPYKPPAVAAPAWLPTMQFQWHFTVLPPTHFCVFLPAWFRLGQFRLDNLMHGTVLASFFY